MDIAAFKNRIMPLNGKLYHFAYLLLKDKSEAEDAVQEVCLKLWKIRESLEQYNSIEAFAMKVMKNWCLDRIKAKKPLYIDNYHSIADFRYEVDDPHKILENADNLRHLFLIIDTLPEQQKHILQLRDIENLEFEEIAEVMDMNVNTVRVNLSRARNRIKEEMIKMDSNGYPFDAKIAR